MKAFKKNLIVPIFVFTALIVMGWMQYWSGYYDGVEEYKARQTQSIRISQ